MVIFLFKERDRKMSLKKLKRENSDKKPIFMKISETYLFKP